MVRLPGFSALAMSKTKAGPIERLSSIYTSFLTEVRTEAGYCMAKLLSIKEIKKSSASRVILERHASRVVFSQDSTARKAIVYQLYWQQGDCIPSSNLIKFLCWFYRNQSLEFQEEKLCKENDYSLIRAGVFQGKEAVVKILKATTKEITDDTVTEHHERIVREAFNLRRLNPHQNIPRLLAYDTERLPYHIITSLETKGNLLDFLRDSRADGSYQTSTVLLQMCIDITDALIHLSNNNMVHRAVMARNVLVGKDLTCKLTSLDSARLLEPPEETESQYSYCSVDTTLEFISQEPDEVAVRWTAPECLQSPRHFTTASDVWALAATMYEVFTFGCEPYARTEEGRSLDCDQDVVHYVSYRIGFVRLCTF